VTIIPQTSLYENAYGKVEVKTHTLFMSADMSDQI